MLELTEGTDMNDVMKTGFTQLKENLLNQGIDLQETPALFKWSYKEEPEIEYQLLIKVISPNLELDLEDIIYPEMNNVH